MVDGPRLTDRQENDAEKVLKKADFKKNERLILRPLINRISDKFFV